LASGWIGRIGASLIKAPNVHAETGRETLRVTDDNEDEL
jgi:hypothetical protein